MKFIANMFLTMLLFAALAGLGRADTDLVSLPGNVTGLYSAWLGA